MNTRIKRTVMAIAASALALTCALSSCNTAKKDVIVDIPDRLYNTEWVGASSSSRWTLIFGTEANPEDCSIFLSGTDSNERMVKYKYQYTKPVIRLTPAPGYESNVGGTAVISNGQSGILLTLSLETYPDINLYLQQ